MSDYWKDRLAESIDLASQKNIRQVEKQIAKYYKGAIKRSITDFENTYYKIMATIEEGKTATPADFYRLDKYWKLQNTLHSELQKMGDYQIDALSTAFEKEWKDVWYIIAKEGEGTFTEVDMNIAKQFINSIWCADNKTWSERVWSNNSKLQDMLNENLILCAVNGKTARELKQTLISTFDTSFSAVDRLIRTEMAHIQTESTRERYKSMGVEQIQFWANPDERTCEICGELHENIYPITESGLVPAHPNCRCCIVPVVENF